MRGKADDFVPAPGSRARANGLLGALLRRRSHRRQFHTAASSGRTLESSGTREGLKGWPRPTRCEWCQLLSLEGLGVLPKDVCLDL